MKIYIGADHAGFDLKEKIRIYLQSKKHKVGDLGNDVYDINDDYPDFSFKVAKAVSLKKGSRGILVCGSSVGACIAANKVKGVRAGSVWTVGQAKLAIEHDNANVICLVGGKQRQKAERTKSTSFNLAKKMIDAWLSASFSKEKRHRRRVTKVNKIEKTGKL
jgi:ribose 5-phosphate isomerase B